MIDETDRHILKVLQTDARISNVDLAERVNLSPTPCLRRVRKLERNGFIQGYRTQLNHKALGYDVTVLVFVKLQRHNAANAEKFELEVSRLPSVMECSVVTGSYDYLVRVVARSLEDYELILKKKLAVIETIADIESAVILKQVDCRAQLAI